MLYRSEYSKQHELNQRSQVQREIIKKTEIYSLVKTFAELLLSLKAALKIW